MVYSQNDEEKIILRAVEEMNPEKCCVFDIGAYDGKDNSNSLALIERGWSAVLVEPAPEPFAALLKRHGNNPRVMLVNAAIGTENRLTQFHGLGMSQLGTTCPGKCTPGTAYVKHWVPQITVQKLVEQVGGGANVLSVDIEGQSFEVLNACPINSWQPRVIVVEHNDRIVEISGWARRHEYMVGGVNAENIILLSNQHTS